MSANRFIVRGALVDEMDIATQMGVTLLHDFRVNRHDFSCAFALDPSDHGFFVGELDNEIVSFILAIKYPSHSAFISVYVVKKEHRGKGYGKQTWDAAWKCLDKSHTVGLDAVTTMVAKYETLGFRSVWNTMVALLDIEKIRKNFANVNTPLGISIKPIHTVNMEELIKYDASVFGTSRDKFLERWVNIPGSLGWAAVNDKGILFGYIAVRQVIDGATMKVGPLSIGPLYADDDVIAKLLLKAAAETYTADEAIHETTFEMLCSDGGNYGHHGLHLTADIEARPPIVIGPRMYTKGIPPGRQLHKIYGTTSPGFD